MRGDPAQSASSAPTGNRFGPGAAAAGNNIDVWITNQVMQFHDGD